MIQILDLKGSRDLLNRLVGVDILGILTPEVGEVIVGWILQKTIGA
jgi:hypothetical protein